MDGISAASSLIAVIQLSQAIASSLMEYYEGVRHARAEIQRLYHAINSLKAILESIDKIRVNGENAFLDLHLLCDPSGPLQQSFTELSVLKAKLPKKGVATTLNKLKWPFEKSDVAKTLAVIEAHKSALGLFLGIENLNLGVANFDILADIKAQIRLAENDNDRRRIVDWISKDVPNASQEHNIARKKHQETTGSWLIDGSELKQWRESANSLLWLNGSAGAGKSILCSTVIEYMQNSCSSDPSLVVAYWYFTFSDIKKQSVSNFLRSLIADILSNRRNTPLVLIDTYERLNHGQQNPGLKDLMQMLKSVLDGFDGIYIIADALDECSKDDDQRSRLLNTICEIISWNLDQLHILLTSRKEPDINESLKKVQVSSIEVDPKRVQVIDTQTLPIYFYSMKQDIKKFLHLSLENRKFRNWQSNLKDEVEDYLASRSDGMFRLAALQLDALAKVRGESNIRSAMKELPKTLDTFYERTLLEIDEADRESVQVAFNWIACVFDPVLLPQLVDVMSVRHNDRLSCDEVREMLPAGMVYIPDFPDYFPEVIMNNAVQFAHFSAKEYLMSNRICNSMLPSYYINKRLAHIIIAETCIQHFLYVGDQDLTNDLFLLRRFPVLEYSACYWLEHILALKDSDPSPSLRERIQEFLDSEIFYSVALMSLGLRQRIDVWDEIRGLSVQKRYYSQIFNNMKRTTKGSQRAILEAFNNSRSAIQQTHSDKLPIKIFESNDRQWEVEKRLVKNSLELREVILPALALISPEIETLPLSPVSRHSRSFKMAPMLAWSLFHSQAVISWKGGEYASRDSMMKNINALGIALIEISTNNPIELHEYPDHFDIEARRAFISEPRFRNMVLRSTGELYWIVVKRCFYLDQGINDMADEEFPDALVKKLLNLVILPLERMERMDPMELWAYRAPSISDDTKSS